MALIQRLAEAIEMRLLDQAQLNLIDNMLIQLMRPGCPARCCDETEK